jgi:hypothetical protein
MILVDGSGEHSAGKPLGNRGSQWPQSLTVKDTEILMEGLHSKGCDRRKCWKTALSRVSYKQLYDKACEDRGSCGVD